MFAGAWCGQSGVIGWVLMGLFWVAFLGLVLWAMSRLFASTRVAGRHDGGDHEVADADNADDLGLRLASGQLDLSEYQTLRRELTSPGRR